MKRLQGKLCVVTAAGQGIGRTTAERFAAEGARVVATDIDSRLLETLNGVQTAILDVTDGGAVRRFAERTGAVDVLFNCAGIVHAGTILDSDETDWDCAFDVNVKSMYRTIRAFLPAMLDAGRGSILNMASVGSSVKGVPNRFVYSASKAAVIGLTKSVAADFVTRGIRCNAICPGTVDSPSLHDRLRAAGDYERAKTEFVARQPMGRFGSTHEIAALVAYLASDEAGFTTGQIHIVDGGWAN